MKKNATDDTAGIMEPHVVDPSCQGVSQTDQGAIPVADDWLSEAELDWVRSQVKAQSSGGTLTLVEDIFSKFGL